MTVSNLANLSWLLPLLFAPFIGSFLGLLILRLPAGDGVVWGRSACPHCGRRLGHRDLVPLLGWLVNRGRCRSCGARLGYFYPAIELAALVLALWAVLVLEGWLVWATCGFGWLLLAIAWIDQRQMLVPDVLSLPLLPAGLLVAWLAVPERLPAHLMGAVLGFAVLASIGWLYRRLRNRDGLGLGDAKLLGGIGAWVAWEGLASVILVATFTGLCFVLGQRHGGKALAMVDKLPFAPHLSIGGWIVWLYGPLVPTG